jgi:hypothetical protein
MGRQRVGGRLLYGAIRGLRSDGLCGFLRRCGGRPLQRRRGLAGVVLFRKPSRAAVSIVLAAASRSRSTPRSSSSSMALRDCSPCTS